MATVKRPSALETDEDLLELQRDFLKSKSNPSATIIKSSSGNQDKSYAKDLHTVQKKKVSAFNIEHADLVLHSITERTIQVVTTSQLYTQNIGSSQSFFPKPFKRSDVAQTCSGDAKQRKSIFAQEMGKRRKLKEATSKSAITKEVSAAEINPIIDGSGLNPSNACNEARLIHEENKAKLAVMSRSEIEHERNLLFQNIDPAVLNFIKNRQTVNRDLKTDDSPGPHRIQPEKVEELCPVKEAKEGDTSHLPIPLEEVTNRKWLNMNKVEWNKLEWMKELPQPKPFNSNGQSARFDLEGNLMTGINDVPVHLGLNHHGIDPELPGYNFEELFTLARSKLPAQRCIALKTISNVLSKNCCGLFDEYLSNQLLEQLIDSGLILLLRCAIDDEQISVISSALHALHSMLVCEADEVCLDESFSWLGGHFSPLLCPQDSPVNWEDDSEGSIEKLTDNQIVQKDVIFGLVRMDLIPRLRYIVEVLEPEPLIVVYIMEILIRIARHSTEATEEIIRCPRLIDFIVDEFLPIHWVPPESVQGKMVKVRGVPLVSVLKLIRVLCSANLNFTQTLVKRNFSTRLANYFTTDDGMIPLPELLKLRVESCHLWRILMFYGESTDLYLDLIPVWTNVVQFCYMISTTSGKNGDLRYLAALFSAFEALLNKSLLCAAEFHYIFQVLVDVSPKWIMELSEDRSMDHTAGWSCLASAVSFLSCYAQNTNDFSPETSKLLSILKMFVKNHQAFLRVAERLRHFSLFMQKDHISRQPASLPSMRIVHWGGKSINASVQRGTVLPLFISLSRALVILHNKHHMLKYEEEKTLEEVCSLYFKVLHSEYFSALMDKWPKFYSNLTTPDWFSRFEIQLLLNSLQLLAKVASKEEYQSKLGFYHELSILTLSALLNHDDLQSSLPELLRGVVFSYSFNKYDQALELKFSKLNSSISKTMIPLTQESLFAMSEHYENLLEKFAKTEKSSFVGVSAFCLFKTRLSKSNWMDHTNWRADWICLPIMQSLLTSMKPPDAQSIQHFLVWVEFLLTNRSKNVFFSVSTLFYRLMSIYLLGDELFLNGEVGGSLYRVFQKLVAKFPSISLKKKDIGFTFQDFYKELLNQFESVSYGDPFFSAAILIPFQSGYPSELRRMLLSEHQNIISLFRTHVKQSLVAVEKYLTPIEKDDEVIELFFKLIIKGSLVQGSLLYVMAIHHVHSRAFGADVQLPITPCIRRITKFLQQNQSEEWAKMVMCYQRVDLTSPLGLSLSKQIPEVVTANFQRL